MTESNELYAPKESVEKEPKILENLYLEFPDMEKREEGMKKINDLRNEHSDLFLGLEAVKIDPKKTEQGLWLPFSTLQDNRGQKIVELLNAKGVHLNNKDGGEEFYDIAA